MNKYLTEDGTSEIQNQPLYQSITNLSPFDGRTQAPRQRKNSDVDSYKLILPDGPSEQQINTTEKTADTQRRELNDMFVIEKI